MRYRKRHKHEEVGVFTESLNDIMFFLMLFFLIVSTLVNPNVLKLMLPNSKSNNALQKQPVVLSINAEKVIFLNDQQVQIENLENLLKLETAQLSMPTVVLRIDRSLSIQDLVNILEIGNKLKLKMVLATSANQ
ncbi:MAG: biopolymer transporter ExbD [Chitinophagales bacterium]|jgi:biopolymer transport protein ExbD|nr:biopolymer transporter ExbD [Chitinophagales bacterium]